MTLALAGWLTGLLTLGFVFVCVLMILIVLVQRPQGGGLSGAFGSGAGSGQTAFGAKTGDALTIATIGIFVMFLLAAIGLNYAARPDEGAAVEVVVPGEDSSGTSAEEAPSPEGSAPESDVSETPTAVPPTDESAPVEPDGASPVEPEGE